MDIGVLTVVTAVLAVLAVRAIVSAVRKRHLLDGGALRTWWAVLVVIATLVAGGFEAAHHWRQAIVTDAMAAVTDNPRARADCARFSEELFNARAFDGYVWQDASDVAHYMHGVCQDVAAYARSAKLDPPLEQVAAVVLVAHETMHVERVWNEAEAECRAVQLSHLVAMRLGANEAQARALQARYFAEIYPNLREGYTSRECREGGAYDIFPERAEFP